MIPDAAGSIGSENLKKPEIRVSIELFSMAAGRICCRFVVISVTESVN